MDTSNTSLLKTLKNEQNIPSAAKQNTLLLTTDTFVIADITPFGSEGKLKVFFVVGEGPDPIPTEIVNFTLTNADGKILSQGYLNSGETDFDVPLKGELMLLCAMPPNCKGLLGWGWAS